MSTQPPRYEFRAFARDFGPVATRMRRRTEAVSIRESRESYVVSVRESDRNVKIRDGLLDIKQLVCVSEGLEQWTPAFKGELPIAAETLRTQVLEPLGWGGDTLIAAHYTHDALIEELVRPSPQLVAAEVFKRRWNFRIDDSLCELADICINGAWTASACVESTRTESVLTLLQDLGLDAYENENYVQAIRRVCGLRPCDDAWM